MAHTRLGGQTRLLEQRLGEVGGRRALVQGERCRGGPRLRGPVGVRADDLARHRQLVGGSRVIPGAVAPDDAVARLEHALVRSLAEVLAVHVEHPAQALERAPLERQPGVERRGDGVERPSPCADAEVSRHPGSREQRLGQIGHRGSRVERVRLGRRPGLRRAVLVHADHRARGRDVGVLLPARALDRELGGHGASGQLLEDGVVRIALRIARVLLAGQARLDGDFRAVCGLGHQQVLMGHDRGVARLEQAPAGRAQGIVALEVHRHDAAARRVGRLMVVRPGQIAVRVEVRLLERVQVARDRAGVLAFRKRGGIADHGLLHERGLAVEVGLIHGGNRERERLGGADLGVRLVGHGKRDIHLRRSLAGQRAVHLAGPPVRHHRVGRGRVLHLVVLAVYADRSRLRQAQVARQRARADRLPRLGQRDAVAGEVLPHLLLERRPLRRHLVRVALHGDFERLLDSRLRAAGRYDTNGGCQLHCAVGSAAHYRARVV